MKVISNIQEIQHYVSSIKGSKKIGYVPTMGYLHEGHVSLIEQAKNDNDIVVLSIFVNPLQFGPNEDFDSYPRDFDRDESIAREHGVDIIFYPSVKEMYPRELSISLTVTKRTDILCGSSRPGHFDGVVTVLTKLFSIVQPDRAYFGLKDAQQVAVVDGLITDFNFPIELVAVPTVREEDGLAKSSRNVRLTQDERKEAPNIYKTLLTAQKWIQNGLRDTGELSKRLKQTLETTISGAIDYLEVLSYPELGHIDPLQGKIIIAVAVKYKNVRLIDNIIIDIAR